MEFTRYSHKDIMLAKAMMNHHIDYTPQYKGSENRDATMIYFEETFAEEPYQNLTYILKADIGDIVGLMSIQKHGVHPEGCNNWLIACLFMLDGDQADAHAQYMVEQLYTLFHEPHFIYVHLHPTADQAMAFWTSMGFKTDLDNPMSTNAEDEILTTYWKKINDGDGVSSLLTGVGGNAE